MKNTSNWFTAILAFMIGLFLQGCATSSQPVDAMPYLENSIKEQRWRSAFLHYTHIFQVGSQADILKASLLVKNNPEIIDFGYETFKPENLQNEFDYYNPSASGLLLEVGAMCSLVSLEKCNEIRTNLKNAEQSVLKKLLLVQSAFENLSNKEKKQLEQNYRLSFYDDKNIGLITERQVENISTAGSTAGSEVGSALASTVYINNALNSASYNVWTDLSVGIMGAVAGSGANKAPVKKYIIKYTIRNLNDQIKSAEVTQSSPIGESIGVCFNLTWRKAIDGEFCTMTAADIRKKYLAKNK